jgi:hypothetical protein
LLLGCSSANTKRKKIKGISRVIHSDIHWQHSCCCRCRCVGATSQRQLEANNGGLTPTHALLSNSPAQDSADPAGCKDAVGNPLDYDQRGVGFPRVGNGSCDKGAFEFIDKIFADGFN